MWYDTIITTHETERRYETWEVQYMDIVDASVRSTETLTNCVSPIIHDTLTHLTYSFKDTI